MAVTTYTYSAAVYGHTPAATPTDFLTILGSDTMIVRVTRIEVSGIATAATWYPVYLLMHSAKYSGGTAAALSAIPHCQTNATATTVINTWASGLPTVGTLVNTTGLIRAYQVDLTIATLIAGSVTGQPPAVVMEFPGTRNTQPLELKSSAQYLSLNGQATALPAGTKLNIAVEWTESTT